MGMTITEAIKQLTTYTIPCGKYKKAYDMAIDTMRKYQKIQEIVTKWQNESKMVFDTNYYNMAKIIEVVKDEKID